MTNPDSCERAFGQLHISESWGSTPGGKRFLRLMLRGAASGAERGADGDSLEYLGTLSRRADFIIADVSALKYLNDLALGFDERARMQLAPRNGTCLVFASVNSKVKVILDMLGLEYFPDETSAMARLDS